MSDFMYYHIITDCGANISVATPLIGKRTENLFSIRCDSLDILHKKLTKSWITIRNKTISDEELQRRKDEFELLSKIKETSTDDYFEALCKYDECFDNTDEMIPEKIAIIESSIKRCENINTLISTDLSLNRDCCSIYLYASPSKEISLSRDEMMILFPTSL